MRIFLLYIFTWFVIYILKRNSWLSLFQRDLKDYPISNVENHDESQGAEKS